MGAAGTGSALRAERALRPARAEQGGALAAPPTTVHSVYVHAPFCTRRCGYCDFAVNVRREGGADVWARALEGELAAVGQEGVFSLPSRLRTLYVGGGTPSLLGADAMDRLAHCLGPERVRWEGIEWTSEANPESFSREVAAGWRDAGVNRVSLGVQSFQESALRWMGRLHGAQGAVEAVARARGAGLVNVSIDLIFGIPRRVGRSWSYDLDQALELDVPHLSLYGLTVEPGTPLGRAVGEGREQPVDEGQYRDEYLEAAERLTGEGYVHYEVSNFARPGAESKHNRVYWSGEPYLGLGNSAHSHAWPLRRWNLRQWDEYEEAAAGGRLPVAEGEVLDEAATRLEAVWLKLRTHEGHPAEGLVACVRDLVDGWARRGWAVVSPSSVRLTPEGWLLLDRLAVEMDSLMDRES